MQNLNKSINDADKSTTKLRDDLDKVDTKVQDISVSAKDIVKVFDSKLLSTLQSVVAETSNLSATITELYSHIEKAIAKNVEEGEKLAEKMEEKMEESGKKSLSAMEVKAIEVQALFKNVVSTAAEKMDQISQQMNEQAVEVSKSLDTINEEYEKESKNIGLFNLKAHKENVQAHIEELNKYKQALEASKVYAETLYNTSLEANKEDSVEFKKVQEEKIAALQKLDDEISKVDSKLKESNASYVSIWKKQHDAINTELKAETDKLDSSITAQTKKVKSFIDDYDIYKKKISNQFDLMKDHEKQSNEDKYNHKIKKLDEEEVSLRKEITKKEEEKARLEKEQADAEELAEKYRNDIKKIKDTFEKKGTSTENQAISKNTLGDGEDNVLDTSDWLGTEEEKQAAAAKIKELETEVDKQDEIALYTDIENKKLRADAIKETNDKIISSERSVLLEQMRIADEKTRLAEEKQAKDEKIEEKNRKRKEKLEKLEKIKAKAQHVINIAEAVSSVAKGVANAWAYGPFIGPPMAALVAIQGAMQIKTMTDQLRYMEDGGLLNGKRHSQGGMRIQGTNIEVEGGEYVVNREATNKNLGLINYINSQRRELDSNDLHTFFGQSIATPTFSPPSFMAEKQRGGHIPSFEPNVDITNSELLEGMSKIKIEPRVSVTDINTVHENMVKVDEWTGL